MSIIKLYDDWIPVKKVFKRPSLKVYFGKWRNDPLLPVWRRGYQIDLFKRDDCSVCSPIVLVKGGSLRRVYPVTSKVSIKVGTKEFNNYTCGIYDNSWHKLPKGLKDYDLVWRRDIRKKLRKYHLEWIKPRIQLPIWLAFHIFNYSMMWKTKWDECRYEFPPQFTIVFFGLSLSFYLVAPQTSLPNMPNDHYWEALLTYKYRNKGESLKDIIEKCGIWESIGKKRKNSYKFFSLRPEYLQDSLIEEYNCITSKIRGKRKIL